MALYNNMEKLTEVARSFSYKLNAGNFESRDFFCSQKIECPLEEAGEWSQKLFEFCKSQVMADVDKYIQENLPEDQKVINADEEVYTPTNYTPPNSKNHWDNVYRADDKNNSNKILNG